MTPKIKTLAFEVLAQFGATFTPVQIQQNAEPSLTTVLRGTVAPGLILWVGDAPGTSYGETATHLRIEFSLPASLREWQAHPGATRLDGNFTVKPGADGIAKKVLSRGILRDAVIAFVKADDARKADARKRQQRASALEIVWGKVVGASLVVPDQVTFSNAWLHQFAHCEGYIDGNVKITLVCPPLLAAALLNTAAALAVPVPVVREIVAQKGTLMRITRRPAGQAPRPEDVEILGHFDPSGSPEFAQLTEDEQDAKIAEGRALAEELASLYNLAHPAK